MIKYENGKIYKIICNTTGMCYIGSTCEEYLFMRLTSHVLGYNNYIKNKNTKKNTFYCTSYKILENKNFEILLLENVNCKTSEKLRERESYYYEKYDCVNIKRPLALDKQSQFKLNNTYKKSINALKYNKNIEIEHSENNENLDILEKNKKKIILELNEILEIENSYDCKTIFNRKKTFDKLEKYFVINIVRILKCFKSKIIILPIDNKKIFVLLKNIYINWCGSKITMCEMNKHTRTAISYIIKNEFIACV
jgi:hypothetical protein